MTARGGWTVAAVVACQLALATALAALTVAIVALAGAGDDGQTIAFFVCFALIFPLAVAVGRPLEQRLAGGTPAAAASVAGCATAGMLVVLVAARVVYEEGGSAAPVLIAGTCVWMAGFAWALRRGSVPLPGVALGAAVLGAAAALAFMPGRLRHAGELAVVLLLTGALLALLTGARRVSVSRRAGLALDAAVLLLIVLAVVDLTAFLPQLPYDPRSYTAPPSLGDATIGSQLLHQGFYLGPVNDVLHGRAVLVDAFSQYGVGVLYFLAGIFLVVPIGYGPMALVSGFLTGLAFAGGYVALRLAGCGRLAAAIALAIGIASTQLNTVGSVAAFPSAGALRYGPAYLLILLVAARAYWPQRARELRIAELVVVGISAVWSAEALGYALAIYLAAQAVELASAEGPARARATRWVTESAWAVGVTAAAIGVFTLLTRILAGEWPDFAPYFDFLNRYSGREIPDVLVFPAISPWSTGFVVGFAYLASALMTVALVPAARADGALRRRLIVTAAITAFGTLSLSYWVTHGYPFTLRWVAMPVALLGALWVDLLLRSEGRLSEGLRRAALCGVAALAALAVVFAWPAARDTGDRTALGHAFPGSPAFRHDLRELWRRPRVDPRSQAAEAMLRRDVGNRPVVVLTEDDIGLELLMRTDRTNALPLGYPLQSALIPDYVLARIRRAVDRLPPGTFALTEEAGQVRPGGSHVLQAKVAALLGRRFTARVVARTGDGMVLVRLEPRPRARLPDAGS